MVISEALYILCATAGRSVQEPPFNYYRRNSGTLVKYLFQFPGDDVAVAAATTTPPVPRVGLTEVNKV